MRSFVLLLIGLAIVLVSSIGCSGRQQKPSESSSAKIPEVEVVVATVTRGTVAAKVELTGNLLPRRRSVIVSEVDGVIESMPKSRKVVQAARKRWVHLDSLGVDWDNDPLGLALGDEVPKGDVLVILRPRDFELKVAAARARLATVKTQLAQLLQWRRPEEIRISEAAVRETHARLERATSEMQRTESLLAKNMVSPNDYDERKMEAETARAALQQAQAQLDIDHAGPTEAEIDVAKATIAQAESEVAIAEERLKKTAIRAPYDAVISDRYVEVGDGVTAMPRVEIMEIMDLSLLFGVVAIPERFTGGVQQGEQVAVRAEGAATSVPGFVVAINDKVDPETRTYRTRIAIDNRDRKFKAGAFARVTFQFKSSSDTLIVPSAALTFSGGRPQVFVYDNGRVLSRTVELGIPDDGQTEVVSGLTEGEQVVVDDPSILADGMTVRLRKALADKSGKGDNKISKDGRDNKDVRDRKDGGGPIVEQRHGIPSAP